MATDRVPFDPTILFPSTEKQADVGVSLEAQTAKIRAMAVVQEAELVDVLI